MDLQIYHPITRLVVKKNINVELNFVFMFKICFCVDFFVFVLPLLLHHLMN